MTSPRWLLSGLLVFLLGGKLDKLPQDELEHWRALRVFVDNKDQKRWLRLKTTEERNAWLKKEGLWDKFYKHNKRIRDLIVAGDVRKGWSRDMIYMAWGPPSARLQMPGRDAARTEVWKYRFEVDKDGYASPVLGRDTDHRAVRRYQVNLTVGDDIVTDMKELDKWE